MAKVKLVKGQISPTKRNLRALLPAYLIYANTVLLLVIALKLFNVI